MLNILQGALGAGTRVKLTGITGDSSEAEFVDAIFPVVTKDQQRYLIRIQGQNIVATKATNTIMSLAVLLKAGRSAGQCRDSGKRQQRDAPLRHLAPRSVHRGSSPALP